ncbi:Thioredoxin [Pirellulimonas nuda]|uniref:Thioredoxin n=1 Tax=Pirellulimonas nuda TaxID=2528009 RepID=A0A518DFB9_9BACT|nr:TlpA disulfide reductase family protein [Pirellulimonas nuda]QDU90173.1 Thioredoxin [Pirellulimonas nuda]
MPYQPPPRSKSDQAKFITLVAVLTVVMIAVQLWWRGDGPPHRPVALPPMMMVDGWLNTEAPPETAELRKGLLVVDCWATWCGPCRASLPNFAEIHRIYGDEPGVTFVGLTSEPESDRAKIEQVIDSTEGFDWPVAYGAQPMFDALGIQGIPTFYIFKNGRSIWSGHNVDRLASELGKAIELGS